MLTPSHFPKELIVYADDDMDDRYLFSQGFQSLAGSFDLQMVSNGQQLMEMLYPLDGLLPYAVFLDMNMPRMNGLECLVGMKANPRLKNLPVIMLTTSLTKQMISELHDHGAHYYVQKPSSAIILKEMIVLALSLIPGPGTPQPPLSEFVLTPKNHIHGSTA